MRKNGNLLSSSYILVLVMLMMMLSYSLNAQTIQAIKTNGDSTTYNCDGVSDQIQINQALEYVKDDGGTVTLSANTFIFDDVIWFAGDNTILEGAGMDNTTLKLKDDAKWCYYFKNASDDWELHHAGPMIMNKVEAMNHLTIQNLRIDGNKYNQYLVDPQTGDTIRDIRGGSHKFDGQGHYIGVDFSSREGSTAKPADILFSQVFMYENSGDGLVVNSGTGIKVDSCKGIRGGHSQVYFFDPINLVVENCVYMVTANSGIRWYDGNHIIIRNNHLYGEPEKTGNSNFCIQMTSGQANTISDDILIESNRMEFTAGAAIALDAKTKDHAKDVIIRNNIIFQTGNSGTYENRRESGGINIKNFINTLVEGNTIVNCIGGGVRLGGFTGFNDWPYETGLTMTLKNNIICNTVKGGGGDAGAEGYAIDIGIGNSAVSTYNNIWGNASGNGYNGCGPGTGDISVDPKFKSVVLGTIFADANDTNADLHVKSEVGRWNSNTESWEIDSETSMCINGGDPSFDYSEELTPNGSRLNLGAYGNTAEASKGNKAPPIADAGPDQYIRDVDGDGLVFVDLDGSGSLDNGTIINYSWVRNGEEIATGVQPTHIPCVLGPAKITLTVTDDDGISLTDDMIVKVTPQGTNNNPQADAGEDLIVTDKDGDGHENVTLDGSGSSDEEGMIVSYSWKEGGTELATGVTSTISFAIGVHSIELTVIDNEGGTDTDVIEITVKEKGNYSLEFNGEAIKDEYVYIESLPTLSTLTIEMWIKQNTSVSDTAGLLFFGGDGQRLTLKGSEHQITWGGASNNMSTNGIPLNEWHHVALVVDNGSLTAIYIDGISQTICSPAPISLPSSIFSLASYYGTGAYDGNFVGKIDELRYWNTARTASQINSNKDNELVGDEAGLVGYWDFNDGSGTVLSDLTTSHLHGNLNNMEGTDWSTDNPFNPAVLISQPSVLLVY